MKIIIIICFLLLYACQPKNSINAPISSDTPTNETNDSNDLSQQIPNETTIFTNNIIINNLEIQPDENYENMLMINPSNDKVYNEITIEKLTYPYYRLARTYALSYDLYYEKDDENRYALLEIKNYRNHPDAYNSNVYDCYLSVPQSDDDLYYHFYGLPSQNEIYIFTKNDTTEPLYFTASLQAKIINALIDAEAYINELDSINLNLAYDNICTSFNTSFLINRTYFPHAFCSDQTSDFLYIKDIDANFFQQIDPRMIDVVYYSGYDSEASGYYKRMFTNQIFSAIDERTNIMAIAVLHSEVICQAGGGNRGIAYMIDMNNKKILTYEDIINKFNLNQDKINEFYQQNQNVVFTNNSEYAHLSEKPQDHILIYDDKIYFLAYQRAEHGGTYAISFPLEDFR